MEQDRELNMTQFRNSGIKNRTMIERSNYFEQNTRDTDPDAPRQDTRKGEITGQDLSLPDMEFGMPIRSSYSGERLRRDVLTQSRMDFDLFDERDDRQDQVGYHDPINPISPTYSSISAGSEKVIPELYGTDPGSFISANINKYSVTLFELLKGSLCDKFCISPYGIFHLFGTLYFASSGITESDIYDYFTMVSKENILEGLSHIKKFGLDPQMTMKHMILIDDTLPINREFIKYVAHLVDVYPIGVGLWKKEAKNLNDYLHKLFQGTVEPISERILERVKILGITAGVIKPGWRIPFDVVEKRFQTQGAPRRPARMLAQLDQKYPYYEDHRHQIIEIPCTGDALVMGVILPKESAIPDVSPDELNIAIKNLKVTNIAEVMIPIFTQRIKIKLTNLLYQHGLRSVFHRATVPDLVKSETVVTDIVQNLTIVVGAPPRPPSKKGYAGPSVSNVKFLADHPFIYYFRLTPTNTVIAMGHFN